MYKSKFATNARAHKDGQRRQRNCRCDCRDSRAFDPRRNAHRCARRRMSTGPVTKRWYTPVRPYHHDDGPPPASSSWHESDSIMIMMQENHPAQRSEQHPSEADYTRAAAVRCCRAGFPCASPASSSCWAGLQSPLVTFILLSAP